MQEEKGDTDEFRDVSKKVERREALTSLRKAADIIDTTVQVCFSWAFLVLLHLLPAAGTCGLHASMLG